MSGDISGDCRLCGCPSIGLSFVSWVRDTFMDHDKLFPGTIICHACQFGCDEANIELTQRTGKEKLQRMRNYSHFVLNHKWLPLSKGNKHRMREILMQGPQLAVIAESGQKHLVFRAQPGFWQFEEQRMRPCPELLIALLDLIEQLYNAGARKSEIESGRFSQRTLLKIGVDLWRVVNPQLTPYRGGLPLKLAIFLAQKEEDDDT